MADKFSKYITWVNKTNFAISKFNPHCLAILFTRGGIARSPSCRPFSHLKSVTGCWFKMAPATQRSQMARVSKEVVPFVISVKLISEKATGLVLSWIPPRVKMTDPFLGKILQMSNFLNLIYILAYVILLASLFTASLFLQAKFVWTFPARKYYPLPQVVSTTLPTLKWTYPLWRTKTKGWTICL